jgi:hypothetical protein
MTKCKYCKQEHDSSELCKPSRRTFLFLSSAAITGALLINKLGTEGLTKLGGSIRYANNQGVVLTESQIVAMELEKVAKQLPYLFEVEDHYFGKLMEAANQKKWRS